MANEEGAVGGLSPEQMQAKRRIAVLEQFAATLESFSEAHAKDVDETVASMYDAPNPARVSRSETLRKKLLRLVPEVREYVYEALGGPAYLEIGGRTLEVFQNLLAEDFLTSAAGDKVQEVIGFYEAVLRGSLTMPNSGARETVDIVNALRRGLRPAFRAGAPTNETAVQDAVESILAGLGFKYSRDKVATQLAGKGFKPDFVVDGLSLAIEVKLTKSGHGATPTVEELSADLVPYLTTWSRLLIVIYDNGEIDAPHLIEEGFAALGPHVVAVVVKH